MIFPFLRGILHPKLAPATYLLLVLNLLMFLWCYPAFEKNQDEFDSLTSDSTYLFTQGMLFAQLREAEPKLFSKTLDSLQSRAIEGDREAAETMGALALRDPQFMNNAGSFAFYGDPIAIKHWRENFKHAIDIEEQHPSYRYGLSHAHAGFSAWLSYQFSHSGWMHLALNMLFLLIFGGFLETRIGSSLVILTYVLSGLAGALSFICLSGLTYSPLVGASASISGLGSLTAFHCMREKLKFYYFVLPKWEYQGLVMAPGWLILFLFSVPDIGGYLAGLPEASGVAHSAHLGGAALGALFALALKKGILTPDPEDAKSIWMALHEQD